MCGVCVVCEVCCDVGCVIGCVLCDVGVWCDWLYVGVGFVDFYEVYLGVVW